MWDVFDGKAYLPPVTISYMVMSVEGKSVRPVFLKKGESTREITKEDRLYRVKFKSERMTAIVAVLEPMSESVVFKHDGEEFHLVMEGSLIYQVDDEEFHMEEGDVLWHKSSVPHRAKNPYSQEAVYITVGSPPTFI